MNRRSVLTAFAALVVWAGALYAETDELKGFLDRGRELTKAQKSDQALPYFLFALELGEKEFGQDSPAVVPMLNDLGELYASRENFADAEPLFERSLSIQEQEVSRYQAGIARTLNNLGWVYEATRRADQARTLYQRVATTLAPALGTDHPSVQTAELRLAKLARPEAPPVAATAEPPAEPPFRVHLTSIRDPAGGARERQRLQQTYPSLLGDLKAVVSRVDLGAKGGVWYRMQWGPLDAAEAEQLCAKFRKRGVWCDVVRGRPEPARAPVVAAANQKVPSSPPVKKPLPPPVTKKPSTKFRIHLTSIRKAQDAEIEWTRLRRLYDTLLRQLELTVVRADLGRQRGVWYRIQGGPLSRIEARNRCASFAKRKVWCQVVPPPGNAAEDAQRQVALRVRRRDRSSSRGTRRPLRLAASDLGVRRFARSVVDLRRDGSSPHPRPATQAIVELGWPGGGVGWFRNHR